MTIYYTRDHEWVRVEGDIGTVGISEHAQEQLGDVVYVELPEVGRKVIKGGEAAVVESVKAASEVYAPVSGEVIAANDTLTATPGLVNEDAEGEAWFFKLRLSASDELGELMSADAYRDYLDSID